MPRRADLSMPQAIGTTCDSIARPYATCILTSLAPFRGTLLASERLIEKMGPRLIGSASEGCRAEHGAKSCGLPEKALASEKLEERYGYYVRGPVEARLNGHAVRVERRNWEWPGTPDSK